VDAEYVRTDGGQALMGFNPRGNADWFEHLGPFFVGVISGCALSAFVAVLYVASMH